MAELEALRRHLLTIDPTIGEDEKLLADMFDAEGGDALDVIARVVRAAMEAEDMAAAADKRAREIAQRKARFELRSEALRNVARQALLACGVPKLEREDFTASITKGSQGKVIITDEKGLRPEFLHQPKPPEPNKAAIKEALLAGKLVPGAVLSNPEPGFSVRRV